MRYSPVTQVTPDNVKDLKVAWTYRIGEPSLVPAHPTQAAEVPRMLAKGLTPEVHRLPALEATPILAEGRLYLCSSSNRVVALDPQNGHELWSFDPKLDTTGAVLLLCRGVSYYRDANAPQGSACASRIFTGTQDARLIALDARDGKPCADFGAGGTVDLKAGLGKTLPGDYGVTAPPAIIGDRVVVGGRLTEDMRTDMPAGVVRAFDAHSGALLWAWNSVAPQSAGATADGTYRRSTANTWSVFSVDPQRNLVFIPTGNAQVGLYGTTRDTDGRDYYASSVVALDAASGVVRWHFQTVHHDVWDYDVPSQPVLFDFPGPQGPIAALAQPTKQGYLFILNRETGEPLIPVRGACRRRRRARSRGASGGDAAGARQRHLCAAAPAAHRGGHVGIHPLRPRQVPGTVPPLPLRGGLQSAVTAGDDYLSGQSGRHELGQRCDRPGAQSAHHQHQSRGHDCAAGAARGGGPELRQGRVAAGAGRHALCGALEGDAVALGRAVQPAARGANWSRSI